MAHSWSRGPEHLRVLIAAAFAFAALDGYALTLGEAEVRSGLGENLDLRIPVTIGKGESIEPSCFTLAREPVAGVPRVNAARVSLERSAMGTYLRLGTDSVVSEPALALGIVAACPGLLAEARRDYSVLVDPRNSPRTPAGTAARRAGENAPSRATEAPAVFPSIATLIARIGDTLESIANAIFPHNGGAQKSYIQALRDTNPPLAALGERDPIPVDTPIALPDLRTFARAPSRVGAQLAQSRAQPAIEPPTEARAPDAASPPPAAPRAPRAAKEPVPRPAQRAAKAPTARATTERAPQPASKAAQSRHEVPSLPKRPPSIRNETISPGFVLKLSVGEVDLSPSKSIDERMRAQLRDRQLILDADDQVAAVLSLRDSVRRLESRVAELQLKLAGMPSSFPAPKTADTTIPPSNAPAPMPAPIPQQTRPAATPPAPTVTPSPPPVIEHPAGAADTTPSATAPTVPPVATVPPIAPTQPKAAPSTSDEAPPASPPAPVTRPAPRPREAAAQIDWLYYGLWVLAFLLVIAAIVLAMRLARRRRESAYEYAEEPPQVPAEDEIVVALEPPRADADFPSELDAPHAPAPPRRALDADVDIETRLPDNNTDDLRRRYIEERFPEIGKGAISLDDPDSVVKGARLFYEDRAIARAVELLQFAIEQRPAEVKSWLALFEIFRLEALRGEFAELARRFREQHGKNDYWRKVQYFGREIDPGNELYTEAPLNTFETIGPTQAKRFAAESSFDPVAENWLGAPMDFQNEVLANELRKALMAAAGLNEHDLVPNPMPALRNVEMFTVA